jgi:hypothetical protein
MALYHILGDEFSASFLIKNKADVNMTTHLDKETALHMTACFSPDVTSPEIMSGMARIAELLLNNGGQINAQDTAGRFVC